MAKVPEPKVSQIVCNRVNSQGVEEYLVKWKGHFTPSSQPFSWHTIYQLTGCLVPLQDYLDDRRQKHEALGQAGTPGGSSLHPPRTFHSIAGKGHPKTIPEDQLAAESSYNCALLLADNKISFSTAADQIDYQIDGSLIPTPLMLRRARESRTVLGDREIRLKALSSYSSIQPPIVLLNTYDSTTPSLRFSYVEKSIYGEGVLPTDQDIIQGCQSCTVAKKNSPSTGCHNLCDCFEFAPVDQSKLNPRQRADYDPDGDNDGFPKQVPYYTSGEHAGCLTQFYLDQRYVVFECNSQCICGPQCATRVVQRGRSVPLTIFRTPNRGWGLRAGSRLKKGQFIDTYRGEIITSSEADLRERQDEAGDGASYLYMLDKFADILPENDAYVVDGRFKGGAIRFMNHSCEPNCRVFTVSYNKYDYRLYDLAMFAYRDIEPGEELTFDYLDKEDIDDGSEYESESESEHEKEEEEERAAKGDTSHSFQTGIQPPTIVNLTIDDEDGDLERDNSASVTNGAAGHPRSLHPSSGGATSPQSPAVLSVAGGPEDLSFPNSLGRGLARLAGSDEALSPSPAGGAEREGDVLRLRLPDDGVISDPLPRINCVRGEELAIKSAIDRARHRQEKRAAWAVAVGAGAGNGDGKGGVSAAAADKKKPEKKKKKKKAFDPNKQPHPRAVPCLCGTKSCRRWLWA